MSRVVERRRANADADADAQTRDLTGNPASLQARVNAARRCCAELFSVSQAVRRSGGDLFLVIAVASSAPIQIGEMVSEQPSTIAELITDHQRRENSPAPRH